MTAQAAGGLDSSRPLTILIVEDHDDSAIAIAKMLQSRGHLAVFSHTISDARRLAKSIRFDVLICDPGLPDGDGRDLLREIVECYPITGVVISGFCSTEDVNKSLAAGFRAHINKPVVWDQLSKMLAEIASRGIANPV